MNKTLHGILFEDVYSFKESFNWWEGSNINERESGHQGTGEGRAYESSRLNLNYSN